MDQSETAARIAARSIHRLFVDDFLGIGFDDMLQEARMGIWKASDIIAKIPEATRSAAMVRAGKNAVIDHIRKLGGRGPVARAKRASARFKEALHSESDDWTQDPQRMVQAMEAWESMAAIPVRLQMLATLLGVGYSAKDIAGVMGLAESRVNQLKNELGALLKESV